MAHLTHLPDEVLTRIFGSLLHCSLTGAPGELGPRATRRAQNALAFAQCSRRLSQVFGSCLVALRICTPELAPRDLRTLVRIAGPHLRSLTLGDNLALAFTKAAEAAPVFQALAEYCVGLTELSFSARSVCVQDDGQSDVLRPFADVCRRLTRLEAYGLRSTDFEAFMVYTPDLSRLRALAVSVDNPYECDVQLGRLWDGLGDGLRSLSLSISSYDGSRQNAQGEIVGDGLENFRRLRAKNLPLENVHIGRLPIRALILAHALLTEPPNSTLRVVELCNTAVWPVFMGKLADVPSLREIHVEKCRIDVQDVPGVVQKASWRLRSFWANVGHWTTPNQLEALKECPNLEKADLYCRYEHAQEDVVDHCALFGEHIRDVRVGGPGFEAEDVVELVRLLPNVTALSVCTAPLGKESIEKIFKEIGERLDVFVFDHAEGIHVGELFALVENFAPRLKQLSFPFTKMCDNIPVQQGLSVREAAKVRKRECVKLLERIEEKAVLLDVEMLRMSMRRITG